MLGRGRLPPRTSPRGVSLHQQAASPLQLCLKELEAGDQSVPTAWSGHMSVMCSSRQGDPSYPRPGRDVEESLEGGALLCVPSPNGERGQQGHLPVLGPQGRGPGVSVGSRLPRLYQDAGTCVCGKQDLRAFLGASSA